MFQTLEKLKYCIQNLSHLFSLSFISQQSLGNNAINMLAYVNAVFSRFCEPTRTNQNPQGIDQKLTTNQSKPYKTPTGIKPNCMILVRSWWVLIGSWQDPGGFLNEKLCFEWFVFIYKTWNNQNEPETNQNSPTIHKKPTRNQSERTRNPPGIDKKCVILVDIWWVPDEFLVGSGRFWSF